MPTSGSRANTMRICRHLTCEILYEQASAPSACSSKRVCGCCEGSSGGGPELVCPAAAGLEIPTTMRGLAVRRLVASRPAASRCRAERWSASTDELRTASASAAESLTCRCQAPAGKLAQPPCPALPLRRIGASMRRSAGLSMLRADSSRLASPSNGSPSSC